MLWLVLALGTALFASLRSIFVKKNVQHLNYLVVAWAWIAFGVPFLLLALLFVEIPSVDATFFLALIISGILNIMALSLLTKALQDGDLSEVMPMTTFTPLFMILTSPLILNEYPSLTGILGILAIVAGAYVLHVKETRHGYFAPLQALLKKKGSRYALCTAFLWSISANVDKIGLEHSSPFFFAVSIAVFIAVGLFLIVLKHARSSLLLVPRHLKTLIPMGFCYAMTSLLHFTVLTMVIVSYLIAIKRMSSLLEVFWGKVFFHEDHFKERFLGAFVMVLGVVLIVLS